MPARTGEDYLKGLKGNPAEVYLRGERIKDVTTHPATRGGAHTIAGLLDMQHNPELRTQMTFASPDTGQPVGLSHIIPRTREDLERRRVMMTHWARATFGMMGRTPDFLNVSVASMAGAAEYCAQDRPEFQKNVLRYHQYIRDNDLVLTHTLVNLQRNRSPLPAPLADRTDVALSVVRETGDGLVVRGARVLATLGPLSDEIIVYPSRGHQLPEGSEGRYSFAFAIPGNTPGLTFLCRESFDPSAGSGQRQGRSHFDHPLASRFEEMDAIVFFDDVLVPWERVFLYGNAQRCNNWAARTNRSAHSGHQVVAKNVVKCQFMLGLANLMVETLGSGQISQVQQMVAEIIENLEVTRACLRAAEAEAELDEWGVMCPAYAPLQVARSLFIRMYPRMAEILQLLGSSSLMALPTEADLNGPLAEEIRQYLDTDTASAQERIRRFRLAWDACCSAFGSRQALYERFFGGDAVRNAIQLYSFYDKEPATRMVQEFLEQE
jgi:4-hydroxyphenylacetate 3-monooxygenase